MIALGTFCGTHNRPRVGEPTVSLPQAITSGLVLACFVAGVLLVAAGLS